MMGPVSGSRASRRGRVVLSVLVAVVLTGCGPGGSESDGAGPGKSGTRGSDLAPTSGVGGDEAEPEATPTTEPGTELEVGESARLSWSPTQRLHGEIEVEVTSLERTSYRRSFGDWVLTEQMKGKKPYFVRATVRNVGEQGLGDRAVPLFGLTEDNTPYEAASFDASFPACGPARLPKKFKPGDTLEACLVILVPSQKKFIGATYRIGDAAPVTWTGPVVRYRPKRGDANRDGANQGGANQGGANQGGASADRGGGSAGG